MRTVSLAGWDDQVRTLPTTVYAPPPPRRRIVVIAVVLLMALLGTLLVSHHKGDITSMHRHWNVPARGSTIQYNDTYPLTEPQEHEDYTSYRIALITDQDKASKTEEGKSWESVMYKGELRQHRDGRYSFLQDPTPVVLSTTYNAKGRGAELSELQVFNGKLYTADDRTGIIYEVLGTRLVPRFILSDGSGNREKGFKIEWMTVKDNHLWIGGIGKDWTTAEGEFVNADPKWIKIVSPSGSVRHVDWRPAYHAVQQAAGIPDIGYLWHEAVAWSRDLLRWVFLPRRESSERYDETMDERRGTNLLITADVSFSDIHVSRIGEADPERGFSSFKIIPNSGGMHLLAVKSREVEGQLSSYITVLDAHNAQVILKDQKIADNKVEGVEFV
ncbi:hypothetical protein PTSG_08624 [Salpingoeca rosetta]|uniref:Soluble calcium-activated nucleotidase 1 n=1 Tax=Salpingoeca rosetta (strain ATCC 50818 / BSB-021) TaxID=946362 RepID=F2UK77_SALR5|nr:uncharacterized protein PTSG_08624 [Salpingoeca rosetta]EGD77526.1 hypothetical protein PTSG_08624 [Salpingoeca rosetta]|eukprot:XP_004990414.1 hypothetical protein PTSG_08624 [Salpingoeca rosetta]